MLILSLDSTAPIASAAITEDEKLKSIYTAAGTNTHSETLLPMIMSSLKTLGLKISDIDIFACSVGPGSFTGVRIGTAIIKGLAFGTGKPCIGVSTLEALAENMSSFDGIVCPVMNARRSQVYNAVFRAQNNKIERLSEDSIISTSELAKILDEKYKNNKIYFTGDGYDIARKEILLPDIAETPELNRYQNAYCVAKCALKKYNGGGDFSDINLVPVYLRPSQAERERAEKLKSENI